MPKYFIRYGYQSMQDTAVIEAKDEKDADKRAWDMMCDYVFSEVEPYDPEEHDSEL